MKRLTIWLAFAGSLLLGACGTVASVLVHTVPDLDYSQDVLVIENNPGGNPYEFGDFRAKLERLGKPVELVGFCNSACTILLNSPVVCLDPQVRIGFHSSNQGGLANPYMRQFYKDGILEQYDAVWKKSTTMSRITAQEAQALDPSIKICAR